MFMPHIASQKINFSGQTPLRVLCICETALWSQWEALWGWDFGEELVKIVFVGNDCIYDSVTRDDMFPFKN